MKKIKLYLVVLILCVYAEQLYAFGGPMEQGWELTLGVGSTYEPVYSGSDKYSLQPYPYLDTVYTYQTMQLFAGLKEGVGGKYIHAGTGLFLSAGIDFGQERDPDESRTEDLLEGTPSLQNPVMAFSSIGLGAVYGECFLRTEYYRVRADYDERNDRIYHGLLFSPTVESGYPILDRLIVLGALGISFMNSEYADAYHGVHYRTARLEQYQATAGLESVHAEITCLYVVNKNFIMRGSCRGKRFLADAKKSPLTRSRYGWKVMCTLMYRCF